MKTKTMNQQTTPDTRLIAYCGLYCANCSKFNKGKCPGCAENEKMSWCKIRKCCIEKEIANCSGCEEYIYPNDCSKYDTFISRTIELFSSTDRSLCINYLRKNSAEEFVVLMKEKGAVSMPKKKKK